MGIAKEAGVANGSLFTYFETKTDLFNALHLELKIEMASAAMQGLREGDELRRQVFHVWQNWMNWALLFPEKRRALGRLWTRQSRGLQLVLDSTVPYPSGLEVSFIT